MEEATLERTLGHPHCQFYSARDMADLFEVSYDQVIRTKRFQELRANWTLRTHIRRFPRERVNEVLRNVGREVPLVAKHLTAPINEYPSRWASFDSNMDRSGIDILTSQLCKVTGLNRSLLLREIREGALTPSGKVYGEHTFTYDEVVNALGLTDLFYWGYPDKQVPPPDHKFWEKKRQADQEDPIPASNPFEPDSAIVVSGTELAGIVAGMIRAEVEPLIEDSIRKELAGYEIFGEVELTGHLRRKRS